MTKRIFKKTSLSNALKKACKRLLSAESQSSRAIDAEIERKVNSLLEKPSQETISALDSVATEDAACFADIVIAISQFLDRRDHEQAALWGALLSAGSHFETSEVAEARLRREFSTFGREQLERILGLKSLTDPLLAIHSNHPVVARFLATLLLTAFTRHAIFSSNSEVIHQVLVEIQRREERSASDESSFTPHQPPHADAAAAPEKPSSYTPLADAEEQTSKYERLYPDPPYVASAAALPPLVPVYHPSPVTATAAVDGALLREIEALMPLDLSNSGAAAAAAAASDRLPARPLPTRTPAVRIAEPRAAQASGNTSSAAAVQPAAAPTAWANNGSNDAPRVGSPYSSAALRAGYSRAAAAAAAEPAAALPVRQVARAAATPRGVAAQPAFFSLRSGRERTVVNDAHYGKVEFTAPSNRQFTRFLVSVKHDLLDGCSLEFKILHQDAELLAKIGEDLVRELQAEGRFSSSNQLQRLKGSELLSAKHAETVSVGNAQLKVLTEKGDGILSVSRVGIRDEVFRQSGFEQSALSLEVFLPVNAVSDPHALKFYQAALEMRNAPEREIFEALLARLIKSTEKFMNIDPRLQAGTLSSYVPEYVQAFEPGASPAQATGRHPVHFPSLLQEGARLSRYVQLLSVNSAPQDHAFYVESGDVLTLLRAVAGNAAMLNYNLLEEMMKQPGVGSIGVDAGSYYVRHAALMKAQASACIPAVDQLAQAQQLGAFRP